MNTKCSTLITDEKIKFLLDLAEKIAGYEMNNEIGNTAALADLGTYDASTSYSPRLKNLIKNLQNKLKENSAFYFNEISKEIEKEFINKMESNKNGDEFAATKLKYLMAYKTQLIKLNIFITANANASSTCLPADWNVLINIDNDDEYFKMDWKKTTCSTTTDESKLSFSLNSIQSSLTFHFWSKIDKLKMLENAYNLFGKQSNAPSAEFIVFNIFNKIFNFLNFFLAL